MRALRKGCREHLSVSFTLKAWRDGKDGGGRQVEVNKEMAAMVREDMGAVPCEDDLELWESGGVRWGVRGGTRKPGDKIRCGEQNLGSDHTDMSDEREVGGGCRSITSGVRVE